MYFNEPLNYPGKYESQGIKKECERCGTVFIKRAPRHMYCDECKGAKRKESIKKWRSKHREQYNEYHKRYYKKNSEKIKEINKRWYEKNKEKQKAYFRERYNSHKEYLAAYYRQNNCCKKHGGPFNCPYPDCIKD